MPLSRLHSGGKHGSVALAEAARTSTVPCIAGFCLLLLATLVTSGVDAQDCIDYGDYLGWVGRVVEGIGVTDAAATYDHLYVTWDGFYVLDLSTPTSPAVLGSVGEGSLRGFDLAGDYAYVAGDHGLQAVDISDPATPEITATVETLGTAHDAAVAGNYAYVADGESGLQVVDTNRAGYDPLAGAVSIPGANDVAVVGAYAYVADDSGLEIANVLDPPSATIVGSTGTYSGSNCLAVDGGYAYLGGRPGTMPYFTRTLEIVDVAAPGAPELSGWVSEPYLEGRGVAVAGHHVYVACRHHHIGIGGLRVVDVSDPTVPEIVGGVDTPGDGSGVAVAGSYAFVADGGFGLQVIDVSDPSAPRIVGGLDTPGHASGVAMSGDYAYVADGSSLQIIDITNPTSPSIVAGIETGVGGRVAVSGHYAYLNGGGVCVVDVSDPESPFIVNCDDITVYSRGLTVANEHVYVADVADLKIFDAEVLLNPPIIGGVDTPGDAGRVALAGNYAYVADGSSGLQVVEISDPAAPAIIGSCDTPGSAVGVEVEGEHAFVADGSALLIMNISIPASPVIIASVDVGAHNVSVAGAYAYVAELGSGGLHVVEISNPAAPTMVGSLVDFHSSPGVAIAGDYAYVGGSGGLRVANISNPAAPTMVGSADTPSGAAHQVAVVGEYAYVPDGGSGLQVMDISNPASPTIIASVATPGDAWDVAAEGEYAYVTAGGLQVVDISLPTAPAIVGSVGTRGDAVDIAGELACVVGGGILEVVDISNPRSPEIIGSATVLGGGPWSRRSLSGVGLSGDYAYVIVEAEEPGSRGEPPSCWFELRVFDISIPDSLEEVGNLLVTYGIRIWGGGEWRVSALAVAGDYAYVIEGFDETQEYELLAVDISTPTSPAITDRISVPCGGGAIPPPLLIGRGGVTVTGPYAYVTTKAAGLQVVDVSDPTSLSFVGCAGVRSESSDFGGVAVTSNCAYVTDGLGLVVCPAQCDVPVPVELVRFELTSHDGTVTIAWETSLQEGHVGFHVERAEEGSDRFERINDKLIRGADDRSGRYEVVDRDVVVGEIYVYRLVAVDMVGETQTFSVGSVTVGTVLPAAMVLLQNRPNPFTRSTEIPFSITAPGPVTLGVYDVSGRRVCSLLAGEAMEMGEHHVSWDGRDSSGRTVASGIYFYRLRADGKELERRLQILR